MMMENQDVIYVDGLYKSYGEVKAVAGISFQIQAGEIFGMVGPNGSGKTTTIECIEGMRQPDAGTIRLLGLDPQQSSYLIRERTGVQLQSSSLPARMRVQEALELFASFYLKTIDWRDLLEELGLADKRKAFFSQLSGGQKQRLFVALALLNQPEVVFLDELTTGLDPQARHNTWDLVRKIREKGTTVFITTHFMDEAEQLCDRVAILNYGRIIALDTPANLVSQPGMSVRISFQLNGGRRNSQEARPAFNPALIGAIDGVQRVELNGEEVSVYGREESLVGAIIRSLEEARLDFHNLHTDQATLEDVYLALTGRTIRD